MVFWTFIINRFYHFKFDIKYNSINSNIGFDISNNWSRFLHWSIIYDFQSMKPKIYFCKIILTLTDLRQFMHHFAITAFFSMILKTPVFLDKFLAKCIIIVIGDVSCGHTLKSYTLYRYTWYYFCITKQFSKLANFYL